MPIQASGRLPSPRSDDLVCSGARRGRAPRRGAGATRTRRRGRRSERGRRLPRVGCVRGPQPFARRTSSWWTKNSLRFGTRRTHPMLKAPGGGPDRMVVTRSVKPVSLRCEPSPFCEPTPCARTTSPGAASKSCSRRMRWAARSCVVHGSRSVGACGPSSSNRSQSCSRSSGAGRVRGSLPLSPAPPAASARRAESLRSDERPIPTCGACRSRRRAHPRVLSGSLRTPMSRRPAALLAFPGPRRVSGYGTPAVFRRMTSAGDPGARRGERHEDADLRADRRRQPKLSCNPLRVASQRPFGDATCPGSARWVDPGPPVDFRLSQVFTMPAELAPTWQGRG